MYRNYIEICLDLDKLKEVNRNAPENVKYCNFLCQDFRDKKIVGKQRSYCNSCRNYIDLLEKLIEKNKVTIEQFKENPEIVNGIDAVFDTKRSCMTCKQSKNSNHFEKNRNECKACRSIKSSERNNTGIETLISDINKVKDLPLPLENFIKGIPKDKLIKVIAHFAIGRKATDTKNDMVYNCLQHFKKLSSPLVCRGSCGFVLQTEFSYCKSCLEKKDKPKAVEVMFNFDENIDDIVSNLTEITKDEVDKYNREQYYKIGAKLGLKIKQKTRKDDVVQIINDCLKKKAEEKEKKTRELLEIKKTKDEQVYALTFNGVTVESRKEDGFVNATAMCKAGKKEFKHWKSLESTKELIKVFEESQILKVGNPTFKSLEVDRGRYGGSWIHPDLAVQLAQWISPKFALQVSQWVREIAITGAVIKGQEKSEAQILEIQNALAEKIIENKKITKKHNSILQKREYHKFQKGPAFYIVGTSNGNDGEKEEFKVGFDGEDVNQRFKEYRRMHPKVVIHYIVYTNKAKLVEEIMLTRFDCKKLEKNHEVVAEIDLKQLIVDAETCMSFMNIQKTILTTEELNQYNEMI